MSKMKDLTELVPSTVDVALYTAEGASKTLLVLSYTLQNGKEKKFALTPEMAKNFIDGMNEVLRDASTLEGNDGYLITE